jgi:hypothetical protein
MGKYDVIALGEILIDMAPGEVSEQGNESFEACPGGAPCNVLSLLTKAGHFNNCSYIVGTPQIQETLVLFIIFAVSSAENLGIKIQANLVINGACIVIVKPKPWNDGKTDNIPPPLINSGEQDKNSQALSEIEFKLLSHKQMVLGSPVVEPLCKRIEVSKPFPVTVSGI